MDNIMCCAVQVSLIQYVLYIFFLFFYCFCFVFLRSTLPRCEHNKSIMKPIRGTYVQLIAAEHNSKFHSKKYPRNAFTQNPVVYALNALATEKNMIIIIKACG